MSVVYMAVRQALSRGGSAVFRNTGALIYATFFVVTFWLLYQLLGFQKHFDVPDYLKGREGSWFTSLYTSLATQSNAMSDCTAKTTLARALVITQICAGWAWFLLFT